MSALEQQIREFAQAALDHFEAGSPEVATQLLQEAVGLLAEHAGGIDATELIDVLAYGLR